MKYMAFYNYINIILLLSTNLIKTLTFINASSFVSI